MKSVLNNINQRIQSSGFLKSVLTLSSGVVVGQAINFLGMPLIGRVYTPEAIGDYTLVTANATIISTVVCLGMMTSFMLPSEDEEARGLSRLVSYSTLLLTSIVIGVLGLCSGVFRVFRTQEASYGISLVMLWLYIVLNTISNICYAYVNRKRMYRVMFWNPIITAAVNVGVGIVFGVLGLGFVGYTMAHILAFAINIVHLAYHANPYEKITHAKYRCIPLLKSYRRFPAYQMPANLITNLSSQLPVHIIEALYTSTQLGLYSMALRILGLPSTLLAQPINRVFFQEASARYSKGENIGDFCYKILATNLKLAVAPIVVLIIFGRPIFALFLGEQWREAGSYAAALGVYQLMLFCSACLSGYFVIIQKSEWNLVSAVASLAVCGIPFFICRYVVQLDIMQYLMLLSCLMTLKIVAEQSVLFVYLKFDLKRYLFLIFRWVVLPCAVAFAISAVI